MEEKGKSPLSSSISLNTSASIQVDEFSRNESSSSLSETMASGLYPPDYSRRRQKAMKKNIEKVNRKAELLKGLTEAEALSRSSVFESSSPSPTLDAVGDDDEENFIFRNFAKIKKKLESMGNFQYPSIFSKEKDSENDEIPLMTINEVHDVTRIVSSAFHVPFYFFGRDLETNRKGIPVILCALHVDIPESDDTDKHVGSNAVFQIDLEYGNCIKWRISRRLIDFVKLHTVLTFRHLQGHLPQLPKFPSQASYLIDFSLFQYLSEEEKRFRNIKLANDRRNGLEIYLQQLCFIINMNVSTELCEFLELSSLSLVPNYSWKGKEGYLKNRIFTVSHRWSWLNWFFFWWNKKTFKTQWFVVRDSYLAYVEYIDQLYPSEVLLVDKYFQIVVQNEDSNNPLKTMTVTVYNGAKKLELRPESDFQMQFWLRDLRLLASQSEYSKNHRFDSFAPIRERCRLNWFIDGDRYFHVVSEAINRATKEIYIHGWWVSPELFLRRPPSRNAAWRLDNLLQRKAMQGVKIYIVVYKEISMALSINSQYTKSKLESLHPNIKVQRHPDHFSGLLYWAHHEKIVVVDQQTAFIGGLDLCYGRFDSIDHPLCDTGDDVIWPGLDYSNPRIRDFRNVQQHEAQLLDRNCFPRMPWHDVHCQVYGDAALDISRHFIQRWNFIKSEKSMHKEDHIPFLTPRTNFTAEEVNQNHFLGTCSVQILRSVSEWSTGIPPEISIYESYINLIKNAKHFIYIENQFFISKASSGNGSTPVRNRIIEALADRIVKAHKEQQKFRVIVMMPLLPAFEADVNMPEASSVRLVMQAQYASISRSSNSLISVLLNYGVVVDDYLMFLSLRKYGKLNNRLVTEQIYVHSKLMVVDDEYAVIGSANLNDRSMLGIRDSEICLVIEDSDKIDSMLDGFPFKASKKVFELRLKLFREHFGCWNIPVEDSKVEILRDFVAEKSWNYIRDVATSNSQIYREVFRVIPDDQVKTWEEYKKFVEPARNNHVGVDEAISIVERLSSVEGSVVLFPIDFMKGEDLVASLLTPEFLLPIEVYL